MNRGEFQGLRLKSLKSRLWGRTSKKDWEGVTSETQRKLAECCDLKEKSKCVLGSPGRSPMSSYMGSKNRHLDLAKGKSVNDLDKNGVMVAKKSPSEVNSRKNSWGTGDSKNRLWKSFAGKGNRKNRGKRRIWDWEVLFSGNVLDFYGDVYKMFVDTHCICISLYEDIQKAKAGHGWVSLLIFLFKKLVSNCKKKERKKTQGLQRNWCTVPRFTAKKQILIGFRLCAERNPNGFNFTELCIVYFVTEIRVSGNWKSMNWFKYYAKDGAITMDTFLWFKNHISAFPYVRGYGRAALINTFRPNHQEKDLELQISLVKDVSLGPH